MNFWVKVVSMPLGFAAFALFLVFGILKSRGKKPAWLLPSAVALATIAIIGGLILQFASFPLEGKPKAGSQGTVSQESNGDQSPVINSHGDVTVTYGEKTKGDSPKGGGR